MLGYIQLREQSRRILKKCLNNLFQPDKSRSAHHMIRYVGNNSRTQRGNQIVGRIKAMENTIRLSLLIIYFYSIMLRLPNEVPDLAKT